MDNKKFQIKTSGRIEYNSDIRWTMEGPGWFWINKVRINSAQCRDGHEFTEQEKANMGFLQRAGILTFLKTSTQLQVWFDDVLQVTWVYEDKDEANKCMMRTKMAGMKFESPNYPDTVSTHYRYQIGLYLKPSCAIRFRIAIREL